jgi:hypothetical protein
MWVVIRKFDGGARIELVRAFADSKRALAYASERNVSEPGGWFYYVEVVNVEE